MRLGANFSGRSASLLRQSSLHCNGEHLELRVAKSSAHLISETVQRRLQQAASELAMDYSLTLTR